MLSTGSSTDPASVVVPTEYLIRHFASEPDRYIFEQRIPRYSVLLPTHDDTDGLSFSRESQITAEQLLSKANNPKVQEYGGVFAVLVKWLEDERLSIQPDPPGDPEGHVIIPEMSRREYDSSKD